MSNAYNIVESVDNKRAKELLEGCPTWGRRPNPRVKEQFRKALADGRNLPLAAQPVLVDADGVLRNGVSRLDVIAGLPDGESVEVSITYDVDADEIAALRQADTYQAKKQFQHVLRELYPDQTFTRLADSVSIIGMVQGYHGRGSLPDFSKKPIHLDQVVDFLEDHHDEVFEAAAWGRKIAEAERVSVRKDANRGRVTTEHTMGFVLLMLGNDPAAQQFFAAWATRDPKVFADPADPRTQCLAFHGRCRWDFNHQDSPASYRIRRRRVATLLEMWDAHVNGHAFTPWNETEATFAHPAQTAFGRSVGWKL